MHPLNKYFSFHPNIDLPEQQQDFLVAIWQCLGNCTSTIQCYQNLFAFILQIAHDKQNQYQQWLEKENLHFVDIHKTDKKNTLFKLNINEVNKDIVAEINYTIQNIIVSKLTEFHSIPLDNLEADEKESKYRIEIELARLKVAIEQQQAQIKNADLSIIPLLDNIPKHESYYLFLFDLKDEADRLLSLIELRPEPHIQQIFPIRLMKLKSLEIFGYFKSLRKGIRAYQTLDTCVRPLVHFPRFGSVYNEIKFEYCEENFFYLEDIENPGTAYSSNGMSYDLTEPENTGTETAEQKQKRKNCIEKINEVFFKNLDYKFNIAYEWTSLYFLNAVSETCDVYLIWHLRTGTSYGIGRADRIKAENYLWSYCGNPTQNILDQAGFRGSIEEFGKSLGSFIGLDQEKHIGLQSLKQNLKMVKLSGEVTYHVFERSSIKYISTNTPYYLANQAGTALKSQEAEVLSCFQFYYLRKINDNNKVEKNDDKNKPYEWANLPIDFKIPENHQWLSLRHFTDLIALQKTLQVISQYEPLPAEGHYLLKLTLVPQNTLEIKKFNQSLAALIEYWPNHKKSADSMLLDDKLSTAICDLTSFFITKKRMTIKNKDNLIKSNRTLRSSAGTIMKSIVEHIKDREMQKMFTVQLSATKFTKTIINNDVHAKSDWAVIKDVQEPLLATDQEWCHLWGHGDGGNETPHNFVSGSKHCNTEQLAIETGHRSVTIKSGGYSLKSTAYLLNNFAMKAPLSNLPAEGYLNTGYDNIKRDYTATKAIRTAPIAAFIRYKIYKGSHKIFDYIFEGQSEFFDENQYRILNRTVYFMLAERQKFIDWFRKNSQMS